MSTGSRGYVDSCALPRTQENHVRRIMRSVLGKSRLKAGAMSKDYGGQKLLLLRVGAAFLLD